jgi:DNA repair protein RadA/Sms
VRLTEPAADLAIAIAVANAVTGHAMPRHVAAIGELSLAGEIRPVTQSNQRRSEATRLGYRMVVDATASDLAGALAAVGTTRARRRRAVVAAGPGDLSDVPDF